MKMPLNWVGAERDWAGRCEREKQKRRKKEGLEGKDKKNNVTSGGGRSINSLQKKDKNYSVSHVEFIKQMFPQW